MKNLRAMRLFVVSRLRAVALSEDSGMGRRKMADILYIGLILIGYALCWAAILIYERL
jgi:hypothetical protein